VARYLVAAGIGRLEIVGTAGGDLLDFLADLNRDCRIDNAAANREPCEFADAVNPAADLLAELWRAGAAAVVVRETAWQAMPPARIASGIRLSGVRHRVERRDRHSSGRRRRSRSASSRASAAATEVLKLILGVGAPAVRPATDL
jgi:hypothetical protein